MSDKEIITECSRLNRCKPRWHALVSDFANMLKAFIGSNYLSIAYAFKQSGLLLGILGLLLIALVTDHCCKLIVKCKYAAIQQISTRLAPKKTDDQESIILIRHMSRNLTYGDIGKIACGSIGILIVNICIIFTQFGFCIGYFIFVGNTVSSLFPSKNISLNSNETSSLLFTNSSEVPSSNNGDYYIEDVNVPSRFNYSGSVQNHDNLYRMLNNSSQISATNSSVHDNIYFSDFVMVSEAPDLRLLVIAPIPIFVGFAFLRSVRNLGFISVSADVSIFLGCVITLTYLIVGFRMSSTWELFNWATFPVFFGIVASAYEGIGTIIPIESSMEGNRHNFSKFLHGAVFILSSVLTSFGVIAYLRYGSDTAQMLNKNIPTSDSFGMAINIFLCVGVILTFPLMIYPVIELTETYVFTKGAICDPKKTRGKVYNSSNDWENSNGDKIALIPKEASIIPTPVAFTISDEVATWKRNLLRIFLVLIAAGIAVLMRDMFAYANAFVGAIGSSLLAYVLPCFFHLKLCWCELGYGIKAKDIFIIVFGIGASVASLYMTISEVVSKIG